MPGIINLGGKTSDLALTPIESVLVSILSFLVPAFGLLYGCIAIVSGVNGPEISWSHIVVGSVLSLFYIALVMARLIRHRK
ncbi:hypothetical protein [Vibrio navarrensis]|uniref:hypothetical protein n=1 Tax=Vibrio navarrensis TaxID=29495 RepID=UPI001868C171|nr:hypothetical protein [Vibrio navarrensis]